MREAVIMIIFQEDAKYNKIEGISFIKSHMGKDPVYKDWYVGITKDYKERLFGFHKVDEHRSGWVFVVAESNDTARAIERYFVNTCDTDGGSGGGDDDSDIVYAYKIMPYTKER
jgi:hypothetical protein